MSPGAQHQPDGFEFRQPVLLWTGLGCVLVMLLVLLLTFVPGRPSLQGTGAGHGNLDGRSSSDGAGSDHDNSPQQLPAADHHAADQEAAASAPASTRETSPVEMAGSAGDPDSNPATEAADGPDQSSETATSGERPDTDPASAFLIDSFERSKTQASTAAGQQLSARSESGRRAAVQKYGGTAESERAVNSGLHWLAKIQVSDGSWDFGAPGPGATPGSLHGAEMGATSMALLCFLGAGHTHKWDGEFRETVDKGLNFLLQGARTVDGAGDLRGTPGAHGSMYIQGLAAICLNEAAAMEPADDRLKRTARQAVRFIERAQDQRGGGWRYSPGQAGDTSVVGWQVMALHSARSAGTRISGKVERRASQFLDSVQERGGPGYGYVSPDRSPAMTAAGLLCRMYLGWRHDHPSLKQGVMHLSELGPSRDNMYYNYYATQVVHHWGGDVWYRWNEIMRDQLIQRQLAQGPAAGSWPTLDPHAGSGGQIYETALCLLTLEIYYRYLPLYGDLDGN